MTDLRDGLTIRGLSARYGKKTILHNVSLPRLLPGEVIALVGPNAAGKSTLMRAIAGLVAATGEAILDGTNLLALSLAERAKRVAFLPQALPGGNLSVLEGVLTALKAAPAGEQASSASLRRRAFEELERLGIAHLALESFHKLSGGQRQLASLAQAAVREPRLLLLDEPTSALDLAHQVHAMRLVRAFAQERDAIILVILHDLTLACRWADRVAMLSEGAIMAFGPPPAAITEETLRRGYGVVAGIERSRSGHIRIEIEESLISTVRDAS